MSNLVSKIIKSSIWSSIALVILGVLLFFFSELTIISISYVIGGVLVAIGVISFLRYISNVNKDGKNEMDIVYGLVTVILGIIVISNPKAIASIIPFIIGIIIVISSASKIEYSFELKRNNNHLWKSTLIIALVTLLCGIFLIFNPFAGAEFITKLIGIVLFVYGVLDIVSTFRIRKTIKKADKNQKKIEDKVPEADVVEDNTSDDRKNNKKGDEVNE